ncbi:hypothetical protein [Catellatospora tritici]|nr:hypothetical protein [Catellatospora tritici]MBV1851289.1 hypothetical protein [Catellatospora tritici]
MATDLPALLAVLRDVRDLLVICPRQSWPPFASGTIIRHRRRQPYGVA